MKLVLFLFLFIFKLNSLYATEENGLNIIFDFSDLQKTKYSLTFSKTPLTPLTTPYRSELTYLAPKAKFPRKKEMTLPPIPDFFLPAELVIYIFKRLSPASLANFSQTSKTYYSLIQSQERTFWFHVLHRPDIQESSLSQKRILSWKQYHRLITFIKTNGAQLVEEKASLDIKPLKLLVFLTFPKDSPHYYFMRGIMGTDHPGDITKLSSFEKAAKLGHIRAAQIQEQLNLNKEYTENIDVEDFIFEPQTRLSCKDDWDKNQLLSFQERLWTKTMKDLLSLKQSS